MLFALVSDFLNLGLGAQTRMYTITVQKKVIHLVLQIKQF